MSCNPRADRDCSKGAKSTKTQACSRVKALTKAQLCQRKAADVINVVNAAQQPLVVARSAQLQHSPACNARNIQQQQRSMSAT